jgi:hypothetical protein
MIKSWTSSLSSSFCSASACEYTWSIQGWIHSKRRNRLGQDLVERLVRTHTNLQLEHRMELYDMLPWDLEMTVEELLSDDEDEDGVPQCVSDSESESTPKMTLTKFLRHVTQRVSVFF